ncbi:hypothetical protein [Hyphococcus sp.]|uniref:hypothetical protein n=1 Tax=Hyphococcus sp. TaxID=2038636 RepID=UPI0035C78A6E
METIAAMALTLNAQAHFFKQRIPNPPGPENIMTCFQRAFNIVSEALFCGIPPHMDGLFSATERSASKQFSVCSAATTAITQAQK